MKLESIGKSKFYSQYWPPKSEYKELTSLLSSIIELEEEEIKKFIQKFIQNNAIETVNENITKTLNMIYGIFYNYKDSCINIVRNKYHTIIFIKEYLEEYFTFNMLKMDTVTIPNINTNKELVDYLNKLIKNNDGLNHNYFKFLENKMNKSQWKEYLFMETMRNEAVDDEVAMMIPGLQHSMKQVMSSNLWDECGNGDINNFHTTWLRLLITKLNAYEEIKKYRKSAPWFISLTSNSLNSSLTNPWKVFNSYGHFLITESWVTAHFKKQIKGLKRVGYLKSDILIYFEKHINIDPLHTREMLKGIEKMSPKLSQQQINDILFGAHQAIQAGNLMYNYLNKYFTC